MVRLLPKCTMFQVPVVISSESIFTLVFDNSLMGTSGIFSTSVKPLPRYRGATHLLPRDLQPLRYPEPSCTYRRACQSLVPSLPLIRFQQVPPALINHPPLHLIPAYPINTLLVYISSSYATHRPYHVVKRPCYRRRKLLHCQPSPCNLITIIAYLLSVENNQFCS